MAAEEEKKSSESQATPPTPIDANPEAGGAEGDHHGEGSNPKSKKKLVLIALITIAALAGGATYMFVKQKKLQGEKGSNPVKEAALPIFTDLDEMIINLNTEGKGVSFMKIKVTLEVKNQENLDVVKKMEPRIKDVMQVYLRELRPADVQGSVGIYRLREEVLLRVNKVVYPAHVDDVLFENILVQ